MKKIAGIDYGSKLAGTTVIATLWEGQIHLFQSQKKKDADRFILEWIEQYRPGKIFIDAPLSLPEVYRSPSVDGSYFYRKADRLLSAMSPMFLGGLTARAMQLKAQIAEKSIETLEVYPKQMAGELLLTETGYKKNREQIPACLEKLQSYLPFPVAQSPANWHQFDALLAFTSGWRYENNEHRSFGDPAEGVIIV